jgi:hypothetical protein
MGLHECWLETFWLGLAHSAGIGPFGRTGADERKPREVEYGTTSFFLSSRDSDASIAF